MNKNIILTLIKGHISVKNKQKVMCNGQYLDFININAHTKFNRIPSVNKQDSIKHNQNPDVNQVPLLY